MTKLLPSEEIVRQVRAPSTLGEISAFLRYEPETGNFYWTTDRYRVAAGQIAGTAHPQGYWMIGVARRRYLAHRLAWLFGTGEWPKGLLDHINGDKLDNRLQNLRMATYSQNTANGKLRSTNTTGYKGVSRCNLTGLYRAYIVFNGSQKALGRFDTPEAAHQAYIRASRFFFGEFSRAS